MPKTSHCVDWSAGAGVQLEVFSPDSQTQGGGNYRLRYIPPFRATIRPPLSDLQFGDPELRTLLVDLDELAQHVTETAARGAADPDKTKSVEDRDRKATETGQMLFDSVVPRWVAADMRKSELFVDFGVDEALVTYPWELMHDGEDFLCLKHYFGRFVNSNVTTSSQFLTPNGAIGQLVDKVSILVICVPNPDARPGPAFPNMKRLPGAEKEAQTIVDTLKDLEGVEVGLLFGKEATYGNVYNALKRGWHIVHYVGHAVFNSGKPNWSALVLQDHDMTTGNICNFIGAHPPVLCFVNACDSANTNGWTENYNVYGLARAFLATGSYLIGSRWSLEDAPAVAFAVEFYGQLIKEGRPIGEALMRARLKTREDWKDSFAWASYVYYGDPRVYFRSVQSK